MRDWGAREEFSVMECKFSWKISLISIGIFLFSVLFVESHVHFFDLFTMGFGQTCVDYLGGRNLIWFYFPSINLFCFSFLPISLRKQNFRWDLHCLYQSIYMLSEIQSAFCYGHHSSSCLRYLFYWFSLCLVICQLPWNLLLFLANKLDSSLTLKIYKTYATKSLLLLIILFSLSSPITVKILEIVDQPPYYYFSSLPFRSQSIRIQL